MISRLLCSRRDELALPTYSTVPPLEISCFFYALGARVLLREAVEFTGQRRNTSVDNMIATPSCCHYIILCPVFHRHTFLSVHSPYVSEYIIYTCELPWLFYELSLYIRIYVYCCYGYMNYHCTFYLSAARMLLSFQLKLHGSICPLLSTELLNYSDKILHRQHRFC